MRWDRFLPLPARPHCSASRAPRGCVGGADPKRTRTRRRTLKQGITLTLAATICIASSAQGAVTRVVWRTVLNQAAQGSPNFPGQSGITLYTFDLILKGDAGQRIVGVNMGDSNAPGAAPFALYTNGDIANHTVGGNVRSHFFEGFLPDIAFDTFVALGSDVPGPAISFVGGANLSGAGGVLRATWFTTDDAALDAHGEMRLLRVTVGYPAEFDPFMDGGAYLGTLGVPGQELGGPPMSSLRVELLGGAFTDLLIGNAVGPIPPTPGSAALLGIAGAAALRRRR